jgi:hypothetical protein
MTGGARGEDFWKKEKGRGRLGRLGPKKRGGRLGRLGQGEGEGGERKRKGFSFSNFHNFLYA